MADDQLKKNTSLKSSSGDHVSDGEDGSDTYNMQHKLLLLSDFLKLPEPVRKRVNALKHILKGYVDIESKFYEEIFEIERKYSKAFEPLLDQRAKIIRGDEEPPEEQSKWDLKQEDLLSEVLKHQHLDASKDGDNEVNMADVKGIPKFWLKVLLHGSVTADMVSDNDQPILESLLDVRAELFHDPERGMGFDIKFHFAPNEYFNDTVLTKSYYYDNTVSEENPLLYDGPQIVRTTATAISWKPGKNVTVKFVKKVKKHKNRKETRTITKPVKQDSFFNFFDPPLENLNDVDLDEDTAELLQEDFRIGSFLREVMIPQAVLYFTGEAFQSDEEFDDEDDDDDDEDDDDFDPEESDEDMDDVPHRRVKKTNNRRPPRGGASGKSSEEKPECNQS